MILASLEHVPHVVAGEVIGELGRIIVCVPDESDVATVWAVAGPAAGAAHIGPGALRELSALLIEAAKALEIG